MKNGLATDSPHFEWGRKGEERGKIGEKALSLKTR
jgi:hypothetical protein